MASDLLRELAQAALAVAVAIVLILLLRRALRTHFGAHAAYRAWSLVPLAMLSAWLPAPSAPALAGAAGIPALVQPSRLNLDALAHASTDVATLLLWAWAAGVALSVLGFALRQRQFTRAIEPRPGRPLATVSGHGPAIVGGWRTRIVLPTDFRERYTVGERRLVLAHEVAHLRRGDLVAQGVATGLRCVFWFNPLVHFAADRFRFDQELACDATVLARFPRSRAPYANAMFKTQLAGFGLPAGCQWQSTHPLKERIEMLKRPLPARARQLTGATAIAMLMAIGSYAAWAAQPAQPAQPVQPAQPAQPAQTTQPAASPPASTAKPLTQLTEADDLTPPAYPVAALQTDGLVVLELLVGVDGSIKDVKVVRSEPEGVFDQASIEAARQWHLTPAMEHGVPVEGWVRVPVNFRAHDKAPAGR